MTANVQVISIIINKLKQMTANVQVISIIINKLIKCHLISLLIIIDITCTFAVI
jgi:hypothetical protein